MGFLHLTDAQLATVRERIEAGPFRWMGDAWGNSPGDWENIRAEKDAIVADPSALAFSTTFPDLRNGIYVFNGDSAQPAWGDQHSILSAAFYGLVTGDQAAIDAAKTAMLIHAAEPTLDWTDATHFDPTGTTDAIMVWTEWLAYQLHALDYIKDLIPAADRATIETWLHDAATFWQQTINFWSTNRFVDPQNGDYTLTTEAAKGTSSGQWGLANLWTDPIYIGGPTPDYLCLTYNNRSATVAVYVMLAGAYFGDASMMADGKRWAKEAIAYGSYPDGTPSEWVRWTDDNGLLPDKGWSYGHYFGGLACAAYTFWLVNGDTELLDFQTSAGLDNGTSSTIGGPKSLLGIAKLYAKTINHTVNRYASHTTTDTDEAHRVDGYDRAGAFWGLWELSSWLPANLYWQDPLLDDVIYRRTPGSYFGFSAVPAPNGPYRAMTGKGGMYPAVFLLFG